MRAVISRVTRASVRVGGSLVGAIEGPGLLVLLAVRRGDGPAQATRVAERIARLRILPGEVSALDAHAPVLLVSQFTLYGETRRGRRPSWSAAAPAGAARPLLDAVVADLRARGLTVATGRFGALMRVESVGDGPFTVLVDADADT